MQVDSPQHAPQALMVADILHIVFSHLSSFRDVLAITHVRHCVLHASRTHCPSILSHVQRDAL